MKAVDKKTIKTDLILEYLKVNNISKNKFCKECKISDSTLNKILNGDDNFGIIALFKIARLMKKSICDLLY